MRIVPLKETAQRLNLSPLSLADKRYRLRIGLPAIHIGRRIGFDERDIDRLIACGREQVETDDGQDVQPRQAHATSNV